MITQAIASVCCRASQLMGTKAGGNDRTRPVREVYSQQAQTVLTRPRYTSITFNLRFATHRANFSNAAGGAARSMTPTSFDTREHEQANAMTNRVFSSRVPRQRTAL
jgi:hypothetical protein